MKDLRERVRVRALSGVDAADRFDRGCERQRVARDQEVVVGRADRVPVDAGSGHGDLRRKVPRARARPLVREAAERDATKDAVVLGDAVMTERSR